MCDLLLMTQKNWQLRGFMCHCTPKYATPICFTHIQYPRPNKSPIHLWALAPPADTE